MEDWSSEISCDGSSSSIIWMSSSESESDLGAGGMIGLLLGAGGGFIDILLGGGGGLLGFLTGSASKNCDGGTASRESFEISSSESSSESDSSSVAINLSSIIWTSLPELEIESDSSSSAGLGGGGGKGSNFRGWVIFKPFFKDEGPVIVLLSDVRGLSTSRTSKNGKWTI